MLPNIDFLKQGQWNEQETFEYRFAVNKDQDLFGCAARCRQSLYAVGFAVGPQRHAEFARDNDWIEPPTVLNILKDEKYLRRLQ